MEKLEKVIEMRRKNAEYMTRKLSRIDGVEIPNPPNGYFHVYQMYTIKVKGGRRVRDALKDHLAERGIMSKVYFEPVHLTHFYREKFGFKGGELPVTERLSSEVLTLPLYPTMTIEEMEYIIESIKEFFQK